MRLLTWLVVGLWLVSAPAFADDMTLLGVGGRSGAAPYVGPGDVVAMTFWVGVRAYSAATRGQAAVNICSESGGVDVTCEDELTSATTGNLVLGTAGNTCGAVGGQGTIATTVFTATIAPTLGAYTIGQTLVGTGITGSPTITSLGTGTGGTGTYNISVSETVSSPEAVTGTGNCTVKTWYDQTGNNFCSSAACNFTQNTVANRATFLITGCPGSSGQPCLSFDNGGTSNCYVSPGSNSVPQPYSETAVAERVARFTDSQSILISSVGSLPGQIGFSNSANTMTIYGTNVITASASDSQLHSAQGTFNQGVTNGSTLDIDGTSTTGTMNNQTLTLPMIIGDIATTCAGGQPLAGYIYEIGFNAALFSSGDMSALTSNQRTFWGF